MSCFLMTVWWIESFSVYTLFSDSHTSLAITIAQNEASTSQGCKTFSAFFQDIIFSEFIYYVMQFRVSDMEKRANGTTFKEISGKGIGFSSAFLIAEVAFHR